MMGLSTVEQLVMVTEKGTSPWLMKVITLEEVPPGQVPTSTTPTVRAGSRWKALDSRKARPGMTKYWAQTPKKMFLGCFSTRAKSWRLVVIPMPNMMIPSITLRMETP